MIRPDMLETVWCAVNRVTRQGRVLGREERVDVRTALEAVTVHAAYQYFEETDKGTLAPGKQADLVILDRDPWRCRRRSSGIFGYWRPGRMAFPSSAGRHESAAGWKRTLAIFRTRGKIRRNDVPNALEHGR